MKKITEENLQNYFKKYYAENHNLVSTFKKIEEQIKFQVGDKLFESIEANYMSIFIYEAVNANIPIEDFRDFMQYYYQKNPFGKKEYTFSRFFNDSSNICLFKYVDDNRTSDSYWDNLHFLFLDTDENKNYIFNKKTFPYLKVILEEVDDENIQYLKLSQLSFYLLRFSENIAHIKPVLDIMDNNPAYLYVDHEVHDISITADLIKLVGSIEDDNLKELFINTITTMKNFNKIMEDNLITFKKEGSSKSLSVDYSYAKYIDIYGKDKTVELIEKIVEKFKNQDTSYESKVELITSLYFSFDHTLLNYDLPIHLDKIDINKNLFHNWIPVKMIQVALTNNKELDIPLEIVQYLKKEIDKIENSEMDDWSLKYSLNLHRNKDFSNALFAKVLELTLPSNKSETKKNKL